MKSIGPCSRPHIGHSCTTPVGSGGGPGLDGALSSDPAKEINGVKTLEDIHLVFTIGGGFILARGVARGGNF
jgi:hypothetical protein